MSDKEKILTLEKDEHGVAILTYDIPGRPMNVISDQATRELDEMVDAIAADNDIKSVVLIGKPTNFLAGADIGMIQNVKTEEDAYQMSRALQKVFQKLEDLSKPVIAAIHGPCLGGGLELALACHYRIATTSPKTVLGLPEVKLGLLPGAGGTQRLPRLIPLDQGMEGVLTGKNFRPENAKALGLVDEAVPEEKLKEIAYQRALAMAQGKMTIARKLPPLPPAQMMAGLYEQAKGMVMKQAKGIYPAPMEILEAVYKGLSEGPEAGYEEESRRFGKLVLTKEAAALMHVFFVDTAAKADRGVDRAVKPYPIKKIGVLGAGIMGAGIAAVKADKAYHVRMRDISMEAAGKGLKAAGDVLKGIWMKRPRGEEEYRKRYDLISVTDTYSGFRTVDLVIEAVFEDVGLKHNVIKEVEACMPEHAIFASNTSAIPITRLAEASKRPEQFIGMHYFSPVHRMPLIEIINTKDTAPEVTATIWEICKQCGKTPIIVNDGVGFYTSRVISRYIQEGMLMLNEGARIEDIDKAAVSVGFPVGPVTVSDEVGLDTAVKVGGIVSEVFAGRVDASGVDKKLVEDGRFGRKNEKGFYEYRNGKKLGPDPTAYDFTSVGRERIDMPIEEIAERLILAFCNESALCLEENILRNARDGDVGGVYGIGFPPNLGGPFCYMDTLGSANVVDALKKLEDAFGGRFSPCQMLKDMAGANKKFF
jgi:3-hydroxyacyl-CoA dehydrogenase / enoyl-CoA hydratase / 3-hydroxybutyryl-CoA epimerase